MDERVSINEGSGGQEMQNLIDALKSKFLQTKKWGHTNDDAAIYPLDKDSSIVFTTDTFTVSPLFFPGGNIGDIAFAGTVNDLVVMGADPIGISMGLVIEEGLLKNEINTIMDSFSKLSKETGVPLVTGDTKVVERGKLDKLFINTSGVGLCKTDEILNKKISPGDKIIVSGGLGEHSVALLSERFDFETELVTDSKPLIFELREVKSLLKQARDPTRGGLSAVLNELSSANEVGIKVYEENIPVKKEVKMVCEMLGLNVYELASEGRFCCVTSPENAEKVVGNLRKYNSDASIIGEVIDEKKVILKTELGERIMQPPKGKLIPRIC